MPQGAAAGAGAMLVAPQIVFASVETERRFVFVIQRGAAELGNERPDARIIGGVPLAGRCGGLAQSVLIQSR